MDPWRSSDHLHLDRTEKSDVSSYQLGNDKISSTIKARHTYIWIQLAMVRVVPQSERIHIRPDFLLNRKRMDYLAKDRKIGDTQYLIDT